ncbi:MAG: hypothetical protein ONB11_03935 [candidate division KSB1 bacterium]|nr:hypothetical protein [candidate division KSB1 bacterium]MDZ7341527.1 hypothetical protein [candidate division KSB1 bacterium]
MLFDNIKMPFSSLRLFLAVAIVTLAIPRHGVANNIGRINPLSYLGVGARAIGLNGAFTAACTDYTAPIWNAAAMGLFTTVKFGGMQSKMSLNRELMFISVSVPTEKWGALALSWSKFAVNEIEARSNNTLEPDGYFGMQEQTVLVTYAYKILPMLSIGSNIKIHHFGLDQLTAWGIGTDAAIFVVPWEKLRLGIVTEDFGSVLLWSSGHAEHYERAYRIGCAIYPTSNIVVSCDYRQSQQGEQRLTFGSEWLVLNLIKFRCGYDQQRWAFGSGFTLPIKSTFLTFNYAIAADRMEAGLFDVFDLSIAF